MRRLAFGLELQPRPAAFEKGRFTRFTSKDGLPDDMIVKFSMTAGQLMIGSIMAFAASAKHVARFRFGKLPSISFRSMTVRRPPTCNVRLVSASAGVGMRQALVRHGQRLVGVQPRSAGQLETTPVVIEEFWRTEKSRHTRGIIWRRKI